MLRDGLGRDWGVGAIADWIDDAAAAALGSSGFIADIENWFADSNTSAGSTNSSNSHPYGPFEVDGPSDPC
jgi:hypothetical protein